jgi:signal transduction histidine kinase/DNA-binding response OmpR family regulator/PAS domain-containing protein
MSKKQLLNRLDHLFANIAEDAAGQIPPPPPPPTVLPQWKWETDESGCIIFCEDAIKVCLGYSPEDLIGQPFSSFGLSSESVTALQNALNQDVFPIDLSVVFQSKSGNPVPARLTIFKKGALNGEKGGFRGFTQPLLESKPVKPQSENEDIPKTQFASQQTTPSERKTPSGAPVQPKAKKAAPPSVRPRSKSILENTAIITVPLKKRQQEIGILEIMADGVQRRWSEEELLLVQEVANQLGLAIENAELYAAVQQELNERVRAEQEILRRNKDLAALNEIGQQISRLTDKNQIIATLHQALVQLLNCRNLTIAMLDSDQQTLTFPVHTVDSNSQPLPPRPLGDDLISYVVHSREVLRINQDVANALSARKIIPDQPIPVALLAVPMVTAERVMGVIYLQEFEQGAGFSDIQADLLSTIASQVAIALANANLFQEVTTALQAIEKRERYQANVAQAVATLTESGVRGIPAMLGFLGEAAQCDYIYFASAREDEQGLHWIVTDHWIAPQIRPGSDLVVRQPLSAALFPNWASALKEKGWFSGQPEDFEGREREFLRQRGIHSILLLAVPGNRDIPSFIALEQRTARAWKNDEIGVLQVAADALANTFVRQDLLEQLRSSLDETETLYKISHNLALAGDYHEMVRAIAGGITDEKVNRIVLVLFEQSDLLSTPLLRIAATWHSGRGAHPPVIGTELDYATYNPLVSIETPAFYNDIYDLGILPAARSALEELNVRSIAVLPLWAARKQLGALLFLSEGLHYFTIREMRTFPPLVDQMATAIENMRLFEQTQAALAETELYYRISSGIAQAGDANDLVDLVMTEILPANAERVSIIQMFNDPNGVPLEFEVVASASVSGNTELANIRQSINHLPILKELREEPIVLDNLENSRLDSLSKQTLKQMGVTSGIFVPLFSAGKIVGILAATSSQPASYDMEELRVLNVASSGVAVALERQRLLKEAQRRALELQAAAEIARDTTSVLSQDELLNRIVNLLRERFGFYHTAIFLVNDEGTHAVIQQASGMGAQEVMRSNQKIAVGSRSIIGKVTDTGSPVLVNNVAESPIYLPNPHLPETRSELGIPLRIADRIIGALDIQSDRPNAFQEDDLGVFQILADQIAVAIENARAYELAQKAYQEMREVDRLKSQFLANMSHELRTPLNSIIGFSRVILKGIDGPINDLQRQDLTSIYNSGQHLLGLINDVLDLSKIEAGKMELQFEEVNIADLVNSVMSTAVGLVKDKPIKLNHQVEPDLPVVIADNTRIRQVLLNFISNAAKFTDAGSITVEARKSLSPDNKPEVMVIVTDTGQGIDEKGREKLFLPFSQVDDSPTRKTGGTGLGLSISRSFIELHGGRIGLLWSEVGKGSAFYFTLPVQQPAKQTSEFKSDEILSKTEKVILAIDDDLQVIKLYERFLQTSGYKVVPLTQPKLAVEKAKSLKPFAITLDIMMPEVDGWQVIHALKNDPQTKDIPVIICSILEEEEKGFSLGASDYLVKPFLQEDLVNAVYRLNRQNRIHRILVVDDSLEDQRLIQKTLAEQKNFEIFAAFDGEKALKMIHNIKPDAVILDLFMPGLDGFQLLEKIRTDPEYRNTPIIILTGADLTPEQHHQLASFSQNMLNKSYLREKDLLNHIEQALLRIQV